MLMGCVLIVLLSPSASLYWTLSNKPVLYNDDITLTCETGHTLEEAQHCPVRQWFVGPENKLLLYNKFSANQSKYVDNTDFNSTRFSIVIKHWTESDINVNYTCSCGFTSYTRPLLLITENFIVLPKTKHVHLQENKKTLSVDLKMERTYPKPDCYLSIGTKNRSLVLKSKGHTQFATYECQQQFKISNIDCHKPRLVCRISNMTIIERTWQNIGLCTGNADDSRTVSNSIDIDGVHDGRNNNTWTPWIYVPIGILVSISFLVIVYLVRRKGKKCYICEGCCSEKGNSPVDVSNDNKVQSSVLLHMNHSEGSD